jgi:eukaryotic-like serine/threonine-protein kinase
LKKSEKISFFREILLLTRFFRQFISLFIFNRQTNLWLSTSGLCVKITVMKTIHKRILIFIAIAGACISIIVYRISNIANRPATYGIRNTSNDSRATSDEPRAGLDWPMFRGGQGLIGSVQETLPEKLKLLWKFKTKGAVKSSPAIVGGKIFVGSSDANLYALNIKDGKKIWSYKTSSGIEAAPCVIQGVVYAGSLDGFLYAVNANSGSLKWKYQTGGEIPGGANWTISKDGRLRIIVGSYDNKLHCVDAATGKEVWTYTSGNYINGSPAIEDNMAVFGGCDAIIHVVGLDDGKQLRQIDSGSYIAASAAIEKGQVYCGNYGNVFLRADINEPGTGDGGRTSDDGRGTSSTLNPIPYTLKPVWEFKDAQAPFFASPALGEKVVVVGSRDEHVYCLDRNKGGLVWKFRTLGDVDSSPVICGDKVIACSTDGRIYILNLADGKELWSYQIGQAITSSPAVGKSLVVVGCDDGYVYAFSTQN